MKIRRIWWKFCILNEKLAIKGPGFESTSSLYSTRIREDLKNSKLFEKNSMKNVKSSAKTY